LWYAKLAILGSCLLIGLLVFARLRKSPWLMWPLMIAIALVMVPIATIQGPSQRDLHGDPREEVTMAQYEQTRKTCESQLRALPPAFVVNAVTDSVTGLDPSAIIMLLATLRLAFVEIKVQPNPNGGPFIVRSRRGPEDLGWPVDYAPGSYVKLELVEPSSGACDALTTIPTDLMEHLAYSPTPTTRCVKTSNSAQPTAR
jgi:uncharacterized MAPEG superfamily protein